MPRKRKRLGYEAYIKEKEKREKEKRKSKAKPKKPEPKGPEAYCMKCKEKVLMAEPRKVTLKGGRPARRGKCPECGTTVMRMGA